MKPRTAIILVAALALIFGAVAINRLVGPSGKTGTDDAKKDDADKRIFPDASSGAARLVIAPHGEEEMVFEYVDRKWRVTAPVSAPADASRVTGVKDMLSEMMYERIIASGDKEDDDALTGLSTPRWVVTMVDEADATRVVRIGSNVPRIGKSGLEAYVQVGDKTYVVAENFADKLGKSVSEFRSTKVFDVERDRIVGVSVAGRENYDLNKTDDIWRLARPVEGLAETDKVTDLLGKVESLSIDGFTDDAPTSLVRYGLDKPVLTVKIKAQLSPAEPETQPTVGPTSKPAKGPVTYGVAFGVKTDENKKVFARLTDGGGVFTVAAAALDDLQPALLDLRDKTIAKLNTAYAKTIDLDIRGAKASLLRTGHVAKWTISLPRQVSADKEAVDEGPADKEAVDKLIKAIGDLKARNFVDAPNAVELRGLTSPRAKITFKTTPAAGDDPVTILVGSEGPDGVAVMREGQGVALVAADDVKPLLAPPASYWDPTLLDIGAAEPAEKVTMVTVTRPDEKPIKLTRHTTGDWLLASPVVADADTESVITLLDRVEKLTATRIAAVGPNAHAPYAKSKARIVIDVTTGSRVPATQPTTRPTTQPTTKPATQPTTKPATQPTTKPATQPASQPAFKTVVKRYRINVVLSGVNAYAWVEGRDISVVGEFEMKLYNEELSAEFRKRDLWEFDPADVVAVTMRPGKQEHVLRRQGDSWRYTASSLMKIDGEKVTEFLKDVGELKVQRFVEHQTPAAPADLAKFMAKYGLDQPWLELVVTTAKGRNHRMVIAAAGTDKTANRYAAVDGVKGVFILSADDIGKLSKLPEDFEKK